jgi:hypothetical protein
MVGDRSVIRSVSISEVSCHPSQRGGLTFVTIASAYRRRFFFSIAVAKLIFQRLCWCYSLSGSSKDVSHMQSLQVVRQQLRLVLQMEIAILAPAAQPLSVNRYYVPGPGVETEAAIVDPRTNALMLLPENKPHRWS